jgi:hypothetical protein
LKEKLSSEKKDKIFSLGTQGGAIKLYLDKEILKNEISKAIDKNFRDKGLETNGYL